MAAAGNPSLRRPQFDRQGYSEGLPMRAFSERIVAEKLRYAAIEDRHKDIPNIGAYYVNNILWPRLNELCGAKNPIELYANTFAKRIASTSSVYIASLGSGDGRTETFIGRTLAAKGVDFVMDCYDLSKDQNRRARERVASVGLEKNYRFFESDLNSWEPQEERYAGVMAHFSLHHISDLERLFDTIKRVLSPGGVLATCDVIGRNGHRRWPEQLKILESIWGILPPEKQYHNMWQIDCPKYPDSDFSKKSFEGVRAQDILPLMVKNFNFEVFLPSGGFSEIFYSPMFGANWSSENEKDIAFIRFVTELNDLLIDLGHIKPTQMIAVATPDEVETSAVWRHWTPQFCVRDPGSASGEVS